MFIDFENMQPFYLLIAIFVILDIIAFSFLMARERQHVRNLGKEKSWKRLRLLGIPVALICTLIVMIPATRTSGMEGLAVLYILSLTAAPLLWFFSHWLIGRKLSVKMTSSESMYIAASPILFIIIATLLAHRLQPIGISILKWFE